MLFPLIWKPKTAVEKDVIPLRRPFFAAIDTRRIRVGACAKEPSKIAIQAWRFQRSDCGASVFGLRERAWDGFSVDGNAVSETETVGPVQN